MGQLPLAMTPPPEGVHVVAYGGGVNTIAMLELLRQQGTAPRAIVMSNPGHEWPESIAYRDEIAQPWLRSIGFPPVIEVTLAEESRYRPRAHATAAVTLGEECVRIKSLPSIAYGWKKCSQKYKIRPFLWYLERQVWAREIWAAGGGKIVRCIGYDAGEDSRVRQSFADPDEAKRYVPRYPLVEAGYDRHDCERLIQDAGLPLPHKSACTFCPSNKIVEWRELRAKHPEEFAYALALEENAEISSPDVVGLMRVMPNSRRQLRVWHQSNAPDGPETEAPLPCEAECGT